MYFKQSKVFLANRLIDFVIIMSMVRILNFTLIPLVKIILKRIVHLQGRMLQKTLTALNLPPIGLIRKKVIAGLVDFIKTFFSKHTILNILTKYCVFTSEEVLMVMRPYQIVTTEKIINRIEISSNYKKTGSIEAVGYI